MRLWLWALCVHVWGSHRYWWLCWGGVCCKCPPCTSMIFCALDALWHCCHILIRTTSFSVFKLWSPLVSRKAVKQGMSTIWAWTVPRFLARDVWFQKDKVAAVRGFANVASQTSRLHPALIYTHALITHHIIRFTLQRIGLMSHSCTGFVTLRDFMQLFLNFS